ncbi:hypothetical protein [Bradyrhizobium sp. 144]|uniref:hypothetical protein n=1 Tax=Bradyrhizobium sp. 144 TaxID=2782620 RepID=UPI001FFAA5A4|nr:hypothetical protein [Bradyrhizobium sp. 144]MCK1698158.1 hypothetical protein [Bradyrhizobium sp. 144]
MSQLEAINILAKQAEKVGFVPQPVSRLAGAPALPETSTFWASNYALILALQPGSRDLSSLREAVQSGQEWLDIACMQRESKVGSVIDGYLLIILDQAPDEATAGVIHQIELDLTACRKHFAWPSQVTTDEADLRWSRIYRVTAIGLPASPENSRMTGSPILEEDLQKRLLIDIKQFGAQESARRHASDAKMGPDA